MQTKCSRCSQDIFVKDEKLPPGPFMLKCPQCKSTMKMSGKPKASESAAPVPPFAVKPAVSSPAEAPPAVEKTESAAPAPPPAPSSSEEESSSAPTPTPASSAPIDEVPKQASTEVRSNSVDESASGRLSGANGNGAGCLRALIELPASEQSGAVETMLGRQGYEVVRLRSWKEQSLELQQGRYNLVFTHQNGSPKSSGVQQFINGLTPELRREVFVVLVGDAFKTADGTQAFVAQADLVCRPDELGDADTVLRSTITEKHRLYRAYLEAQSKREAGKL